VARLYANENFPLDTVVVLRDLGHDVLTSAERGHAGRAIPDEVVLAAAVEADRAVVTFDRRDFIRLHALEPEHAGIIVCTSDSAFEDLARRIDSAIRAVPDLHGQLIRVYRTTTV
jgi:hypothetical protein